MGPAPARLLGPLAPPSLMRKGRDSPGKIFSVIDLLHTAFECGRLRMARPERIAALDDALEHNGDLWQFGTATLKGFADEFMTKSSKKLFEDQLDPHDPLLQTENDPLLRTAEVAQIEGHLDAADPLLLGHKETSARQLAVDEALANDGDLEQFGTATLKAALFKRGLSFDRDTADASQGQVPGIERSSFNGNPMLPRPPTVPRAGRRDGRTPPQEVAAPAPAAPAPAAPDAPAAAPAQPFGNDTLRGLTAGAPPIGFPHHQSALPRMVRTAAVMACSDAPPTSPRALHGAVTTYHQRAMNNDLTTGVSPRDQLLQPPDSKSSVRNKPPEKPPDCKISEEMMNQKWGSVLRTLQPGGVNHAGGAGAAADFGRLDGKLTSQINAGASPRAGLSSDAHSAAAGSSLSSPRFTHYAGQQLPVSSPRHLSVLGNTASASGSNMRAAAYRRMI